MPSAPPALDDSAIRRIATGLLACTLPAADWTHQAHFAAALWWCRHQPGFNTAAMGRLIRRYNLSCGKANTATGGYHHSITRASLGAARAALASAGEAPLSAVLARLMAGPFGRPDWLLAHWSRERLFTRQARHHWLPPDRAPLPFPA